MARIALYLAALLLALVCFSALASADHHEPKKHRSDKKAHSELEGSETWRKLHKSNKHSKERFHHHEKHGGEKELKNIQKHAVLSVSRHEASLQGDTLVNHRAAHSKRQRDPHSTDIHLQDLDHPNGQHHGRGGHAQPHHERLTHAGKPSKHSETKRSHENKHERHYTVSMPVRSGHQIHRPVSHVKEAEESPRPYRLHTNSRARSALRYAKQSRRVHKDGKERKFKKAFEKKQHSKPHYLW
uniref:Putative secreted protein n=1 Tax=Amblyomma cajennense TaxID=34607 RepID=A0A023FGB9_AMBCJ